MGDYNREIKALLVAAGCKMVRQAKGSHEQWESPITGKRFIVQHRLKSRHTANGILEQAGLPKKF